MTEAGTKGLFMDKGKMGFNSGKVKKLKERAKQRKTISWAINNEKMELTSDYLDWVRCNNKENSKTDHGVF